MAKRNTVAAIDVGTTKICTVIADLNGGGGVPGIRRAYITQ